MRIDLGVVREIIEDKVFKVSQGRTIVIGVPEELFSTFKSIVDEYGLSEDNLLVLKIKLSGYGRQHYSMCTIINPYAVEDKRALKEFKMLPAKLNGFYPIYEEISI